MSVTAIFKFTKTLRRLHQGPLGIYVDELVALLEAQGYSRKSTDEILRVVADFSRWLYGRRLGVGDVDADRVRSFLVHRRRTRSVGRSDPAALRKMLDLLYKKGVGHIASPSKTCWPMRACEGGFRALLVAGTRTLSSNVEVLSTRHLAIPSGAF
jgi:hypothetical protein